MPEFRESDPYVRANATVVEHVLVDSLKPYPGNARSHSKKQIAKIARSIGRFGIPVPILVDEDDVIIAGHAVVEAAKLAGLREVPTLRVENLSDEDKRALRLALNRLAEDGQWDRERLAMELTFLVDRNFDMELTGFEIPEIDLRLDEQALVAGEEPGPEDEIPPLEAARPSVTQRGDVWLLGRHRLVCGDARDSATYENLLGAERAAVTFTDPPYNVRVADIGGRGRVRHREFAMASGEMSRAEYTDFLRSTFVLIAAHSTNGAVAFICTDAKHLAEMVGATEEAFDEHLTLVVWNKLTGGMGGLYRNQHELVFVEKVGTGPIVNNVQLGRYGRNRSTVWSYRGLASFGRDRVAELAMHPTVKPTAMVADAILDVSRRGDVVLDPFAGSGTTAIAAEKTGRRARLVELDGHYCDVIVRRWQKYSGKVAIMEGTGTTFEVAEAGRLEAAKS